MASPSNPLQRIALPADALAQAVVSHSINLVLAGLDLDAIISRVDLNAVIDRVDIERILNRVDMNRVIEGVDINALVAQTDLGRIIVESTEGFATEALDMARSQAVGLDQFADRWVGRLLYRKRHRPSKPVSRRQTPALT